MNAKVSKILSWPLAAFLLCFVLVTATFSVTLLNSVTFWFHHFNLPPFPSPKSDPNQQKHTPNTTFISNLRWHRLHRPNPPVLNQTVTPTPGDILDSWNPWSLEKLWRHADAASSDLRQDDALEAWQIPKTNPETPGSPVFQVRSVSFREGK